MPKFIIWTRSRDDWPSDEMLFPPTSGLSLLHLPCITTRPLPLAVTGTAAGRFAVLFFTSVRAIRMSLADPGLAAIVRSAPLVLTFGERCARELAHGGVACERPAVESARELVRHFAQKIAPTLPAGAQLAAIGPLHPAYNAKPAISSLGFGYTYLAIYETVPALELKDDERSALSHSLDGVVCFASPSAVKAFADTLLNGGGEELGERLHAVVIGRTTARECRRFFRNVHLAEAQNVSALALKAKDLCLQLSSERKA